MYPSTKVDYEQIGSVPAYNYVFPVSSQAAAGFCNYLTGGFPLTEPLLVDSLNTTPEVSNAFAEGIDSFLGNYADSPLGKAEEVLRKRELTHAQMGGRIAYRG